MSAKLTPQEAHAAVLAGKTVRVVVGNDPGDPVLLNYLDRTYEFDNEPQIFTESIGGWSEGVKEAVCDPCSDFYITFVSDVFEITIEDEEPYQRESKAPVRVKC